MLDDLRNSASDSYQEDEYYQQEESYAPVGRRENLLGMSAVQRFVIMFMILLMACMLGSLCLLLTNKVVLPIF